MSYDAWIAENVTKPYGKCRTASHAMATYFPELRVERGFYDDFVWGSRLHCWCVAPDGTIIDPTRGQFPSLGTGEYRSIRDESEVPTGVCLDCGGFVFGGETFCSDTCARLTDAYMAEVVRGNW